MIKEALPLLKMARKHHVPFIINDRLDVCLAIDADGIHLGQEDMPVNVARRILGQDKIIGLSCHGIPDIKKGQKEKVDYLGFGPVFKTATKPESKPKGLRAFKRACELSRFPVFGIGGITWDNLDKISCKGKIRIAVCRELCLAQDVTETTRKLKEKIYHV